MYEHIFELIFPLRNYKIEYFTKTLNFFQDLEKALTMVLVNTITSDDYKRIAELLDLSENVRIDIDAFSAMAALAERLMCSTHV